MDIARGKTLLKRPALSAILVLASLAGLAGRAGIATPVHAGAGQTCAAQGPLNANPSYVRITFTNQCGQPVQLAVDVAADTQSEETGLMNVASLPADQGELFDLANVDNGSQIQLGFWMEDTLIPLSIAFIGSDETIHETQDMAANTTNLHVPSAPYLYAVEANQGWFASHEIVAGSKVDLSAALATVTGTTNP
jgi:uncharacterized protein